MKNILAFIEKFKSKQIFISLDDSFENLRIRDDMKNLSLSDKQDLAENNSTIISFLKDQILVNQKINKASPQSSYPLSDAQRRLWVLSQFEGVSASYNLPGEINLNQYIDIESFKRAIDSVIERHEILRTVFKEDESGEIKQWILNKEDLSFNIDYKDYTTQTNKEEKAKQYITEDSYKPFDLAQGPLLRAALLHLKEDTYIFYFNMHHIISDGWSMEVLTKDVLLYYHAYKENKEAELKPLPIQYKDYSAWQLSQQQEESNNLHRDFWLESLSGELPLLDLPGTKQRPRIKTNNGQSISTYIDADITGKLRNYSHAHGGSLFMSLLAAWNVLIYRYTSQTDIITGTPVAGRNHADLEDQIGFYINTLALRNEVSPKENFDELFLKVKQSTLKAYVHQMYPFDRIVKELNLQRDISRSEVFDVMLILQNGENIPGIELQEEELNTITDRGYSASKFDIAISVQELGNYLSLKIVYNPDVYEKEIIEGLLNHYKQLITALLENPQQQLSQIDYLSLEEKQELLVKFNDTKIDYPKDKTIADLFEEQVVKTPDHTALVFNEQSLSYKELDEISNQLAHYLQENYKINPDDLVGIKQERSEWMIISVLGILKAGGAYVPIDPEYPQERIEYIESDTKCKTCIDEKELTKFKQCKAKYAKKKITSLTKPGNLAYVIYTSGSTGKPKGVMVEHKSVVRLVKNTNIYSFSSSDKLLSTGAISFDATTFEYWGPLLNGGQLVLCSQRILLDNKLLNEEIRSKSINIMWFTSGWLNQLVESEIRIFSELKTIIAGGDKLSPSHIKKLIRNYPELEIINGYGPTENTTFSTTHNILEVAEVIPIGNPINNTQIYILNKENKLQPKGIIGEICIGGDGLARGYLNQKELTKEKFISNPFNKGERLYKTGDLGRWIKAGNIEFLGRKDDQVKIRGYRIELGEIEHALLKQDQIEAVVVVVKENQYNEKELVAYLTAKSEQNTSALRAYLKKFLPEYMLPAHYVQLEEFPLTSNGKIDKKSLPDPEGMGLKSGVDYVGPRNEIEETLLKIWKEILQRENIGVKDDFFALGGHSLKAIRLSNEYQKKLALKLSLKDLFTHTSIESQSELMEIRNWIGVDSEHENKKNENLETFNF